MFFVGWDWHIKNSELSEFLEWPMLFMGQWRMSLIFLISGVGVYLAMGYRSARKFAKDRLKRILLPLVVGMLLVVPPQVYVERLAQGNERSYWEFYPSVFDLQPYPEGNFSWHHLWYLAYLFTYCMLLLPLLSYLRQRPLQLEGVKNWMVLVLPALWLGMGELLLRPHFPPTNALIDDWANHFLYVSIFLSGVVIISSPILQEKILQLRTYSLTLAIALTALLYVHYWLPEQEYAAWELQLYHVLRGGNRWLWLMSLLGYAMRYLSKPSSYLKEANEMVYPFYILHQTVIVVLGYFIKDLPWPVALKFCFLVLATFFICFGLIRHVIMQVNVLRVPFGLKAISPAQTSEQERTQKKLAA